jgi:hypothetical protein
VRKRLAVGITAISLVVIGGVVVLTLGSSGRTNRRDAREESDRGNRIEARDPDQGGKPDRNPNREAYEDHAYPRGYITADEVQQARDAYTGLPVRLSRTDFQPDAREDAAIRDGVGTDWSFIGPDVGTAPGPVTESLRDSITSGRITALAVDPNCGSPGHGCRLWVAAAGGGIWRTPDALANPPQWRSVNNGLPTNALGSLIVDPNDASGNTLYAGTGEANTINQAGLGLFKSTDGGDNWALVPGSVAAAKDRSIGAVRVDPTDPQTIWIGTALGSQGQSSINGGIAQPPNAPTLGVYKSTDGGQSFSLAFSRPRASNSPASGVNDIELDPNHHDRVYAALFGQGIWRTAAALEGGDASWKQVFAPAVPNSGDQRTEFAVTEDAGHLRIYTADGGFDADDNPIGDFYRVDNADVPAATLSAAGANPGWTKLSSATNGDPGFASHNLCQSQCSYDLFVDVDPTNPDIVWFGGSMVYEEIRPLQDQSLEGKAPNRSNGRSVMRSQDAGVHFTDMTADNQGAPTPAGPPYYEQMHPDQHALVFDPQNPDIAFVGSDGGLVRTDGTFDDQSGQCSSRDGVSSNPTDLAECQQWLSKVPHEIVNMNAGLATLQFVSLSVDPRDATGELLGGTQDNGTFAYAVPPGGSQRSWFESVNGDGSASGFDVADPDVRYHTYFLGAGDINHHGADPTTWSFITQPVVNSGENVSFYTPVITDPKVSGTIYLGAQRVWRTKDNGGNAVALEAHCASPGGVPKYDGTMTCGDFEPIGADLTAGGGTRSGQYVAAVERASSDTGTMWVATRLGRLFVSKNADAAAQKVSYDRIDKPSTPTRFISGVAIDPADPNHAFVSYSGYNAATPSTPGHVFDVHYDPGAGTATFTDISHDLADQPVTDVAYDDATGDLYASTDNGVVRLAAGATAWSQAASGLPLASVPGLTIVPGARVLYAATYGRSGYRLALAPAAKITGPDTVTAGQAAVFDGSGSSAFGGAALTYRWTLPDGSTQSGPTVSFRPTSAGPATISLQVTAPDGRKGAATKSITVNPGSGGGNGGSGGTGGGGSTTTTPAPQNPIPGVGPTGAAGRLRVRSRRLRVAHNRTVKLLVACPADRTAGCAGRLTLKAGGRTLGSARFALAAGSRRSIRLRISRAALRRLGRHRRVRAQLTVAEAGLRSQKVAVVLIVR